MDYLKRLPLGFHFVALVLITGMLYQLVETYRQASFVHDLANPEGISVDETTPPLLIFTKALFLNNAGNTREATRLYDSLRNTPNLDLRARALHNLGAIYLRDGANRWNTHGVLDYAHISTQLELAKENLREALRLNPQDLDARHNLEYAYRITPPPKELGKANFKGTKSSVFSTLPGLPAGGP